ncbi:unnamed protein product, partial [Polarella glacialis]
MSSAAGSVFFLAVGQPSPGGVVPAAAGGFGGVQRCQKGQQLLQGPPCIASKSQGVLPPLVAGIPCGLVVVLVPARARLRRGRARLRRRSAASVHLSDRQLHDFCRDGFVRLEVASVPAATHDAIVAALDKLEE